jgi:hypothetical protein
MNFERPNSSVPSPVPCALLPDNSAGRISRELWWMNQILLSISFHHISAYSYITWGTNTRSVGGCSSETSSYLIDMNIVITKVF